MTEFECSRANHQDLDAERCSSNGRPEKTIANRYCVGAKAPQQRQLFWATIHYTYTLTPWTRHWLIHVYRKRTFSFIASSAACLLDGCPRDIPSQFTVASAGRERGKSLSHSEFPGSGVTGLQLRGKERQIVLGILKGLVTFWMMAWDCLGKS